MPSYDNIMQAMMAQQDAARQRRRGSFDMRIAPPIPHYGPIPGYQPPGGGALGPQIPGYQPPGGGTIMPISQPPPIPGYQHEPFTPIQQAPQIPGYQPPGGGRPSPISTPDLGGPYPGYQPPGGSIGIPGTYPGYQPPGGGRPSPISTSAPSLIPQQQKPPKFF
jgi:hypothetical protein